MIFIGNKKGFSLVELVLAVSILSLGIVGVLRAYATSVSVLEAAQDTIYGVCLLKEKMGEIERTIGELEEKQALSSGESGKFGGTFSDFKWQWTSTLTPIENFYGVYVTVYHKDKSRRFSLATAYVIKSEEDEEGEEEGD